MALFVIQIEQAIRKVSLRVILGGVVGMIIGLLIAFLFAYGLSFVSNIMEKRQVVPWIYALLTGIMGYLGLVLGSKKVEEVSLFGWGPAKEISDYRILDTSVIIDGRIADICDTGFMDGNLMVPRFVLDELQYIADSSDSMKRARGRRGLDILNRMQRSSGIYIDVVDHDFPKIKGVDAKLVALAKKTNGKIITNDFNLNKVAELQGIKILNVNELANALKPVVLPGETDDRQDHQGRQGTGAGGGLSGRRHDDHRGQRPEVPGDDRGGAGHQRPADDGRPDDLFGTEGGHCRQETTTESIRNRKAFPGPVMRNRRAFFFPGRAS